MLKAQSKVSKRKRGRRDLPVAAKVEAVERMKRGANVTELAHELGVDRTLLYYWKYRLTNGTLRAPAYGSEEEPLTAEQRELQKLRGQLAQAQIGLGRKTAELDFFMGALRQIERVVPSPSDSSASGSMSTSPAARSRKARSPLDECVS